MARPKRDWTDEARLVLWRNEVFARTECDSFYEADKFLGMEINGSAERPRFFERVFNRDQFPSSGQVTSIALIRGFEDTAELINSPMWNLLKTPPSSIQQIDSELRFVMVREKLIYPYEDQWSEHLARFRSDGISEARAYSIVVERFAKAQLKSDFSRLEYLLLNLYRAQQYRRHSVIDEMAITVDTALDRFFHAHYEYEEGREFYQLAINRSIGRSMPSHDYYGLRCPVFSPPMLRKPPANTL